MLYSKEQKYIIEKKIIKCILKVKKMFYEVRYDQFEKINDIPDLRTEFNNYVDKEMEKKISCNNRPFYFTMRFDLDRNKTIIDKKLWEKFKIKYIDFLKNQYNNCKSSIWNAFIKQNPKYLFTKKIPEHHEKMWQNYKSGYSRIFKIENRIFNINTEPWINYDHSYYSNKDSYLAYDNYNFFNNNENETCEIWKQERLRYFTILNMSTIAKCIENEKLTTFGNQKCISHIAFKLTDKWYDESFSQYYDENNYMKKLSDGTYEFKISSGIYEFP